MKYLICTLFAFILFLIPATYKINPIQGDFSRANAQMVQPLDSEIKAPYSSKLGQETLEILSRTSSLVAKYGIRPPYKGKTFSGGEKLTHEEAVEVLPYIIACESQGRNVSEIDSNHKMSRGLLQYQDITWKERQEQSGIEGKPTQALPAIAMSLWSLQNGFIGQWSCSRIEKIIK